MEKLKYAAWVAKYFDKKSGHTYWTSLYERQEKGFHENDLSHYSKEDLREEYNLYKEDKNDFNMYDESTNELVK